MAVYLWPPAQTNHNNHTSLWSLPYGRGPRFLWQQDVVNVRKNWGIPTDENTAYTTLIRLHNVSKNDIGGLVCMDRPNSVGRRSYYQVKHRAYHSQRGTKMLDHSSVVKKKERRLYPHYKDFLIYFYLFEWLVKLSFHPYLTFSFVKITVYTKERWLPSSNG